MGMAACEEKEKQGLRKWGLQADIPLAHTGGLLSHQTGTESSRGIGRRLMSCPSC